MELRPCIDIHNGKVKQLVGGSIQDQGDSAQENYISSQDAAWYARLFQEKGLKNGHVILLNSKDSAYYEQTRQQALSALQAYPGGLQVGGGITAENAREYLDAGASHVIVTSYVFRNGDISFENPIVPVTTGSFTFNKPLLLAAVKLILMPELKFNDTH